jgi:hypothetical protein
VCRGDEHRDRIGVVDPGEPGADRLGAGAQRLRARRGSPGRDRSLPVGARAPALPLGLPGGSRRLRGRQQLPPDAGRLGRQQPERLRRRGGRRHGLPRLLANWGACPE